MIRLRMDTRLNGRVDESDIIQEAYTEAANRYEQYLEKREVSEFVWLRFLTMQKLAQMHRKHLQVQARTAALEVSMNQKVRVDASSGILARSIVDSQTSPSEHAVENEIRNELERVLTEVPDIDREVIALRHFEQLNNAETAEILDITTEAAYKRYVRALEKVRKVIEKFGNKARLGFSESNEPPQH